MKIQHLYRYPHFYQYKHPFLPFFQIEILEYWIFFLISFKKSWDWILRWVRYKKESVFQKKTSINFRTFDDDDEGADADAGVIRHVWWRQRARKCSKEYEKDEEMASSRTILLQGCRIEEVFDFCKEKSMILRHVTGVGYPVYQS